MRNHTPGPWHLRVDRHHFTLVGMGIEWMRSHSSNDRRNAELVASELGQRELADARLIAASPDLLEACEALIRYFDPTPDESRPTLAEIVDMASDAIIKATGGQS